MNNQNQPGQDWKAGGRLFAFLAFLITATLPAKSDPLQPVSIVNLPAFPPSGGSSDSLSPIITPDGRYVLFASLANNLTLLATPNPTPPPVPPAINVFLRDRLGPTTRLVSISSNGAGGGNGDSMPRNISTNGQYVLFESAATNLVPGDGNGVTDIFVRDLINNVTVMISTGTNGTAANGISRSATMTPDGRYVVFVSAASNLVDGDTNGISDVFARDLQAGTTTLVSAGAHSTAGFPSSELPVITPNGRYVAFYSTATNLVPGVTNIGGLFLRDLVAGTTAWVSTNSHSIMQSLQNNSNAISCNHEISDDGLFVAYEACPLVSGAAYSTASAVLLRHNLATGSTDIVNTNVLGIPSGSELTAHNLSMTPDGRFIAFVANAHVTNGAQTAIAVWDAQSNTTVLASLGLNPLVPTNSLCDWPAITPDGRFVAFLSNATNLTANPQSSGFHLYVQDLQSVTTTLVDADTNGFGSTPILTTAPQLSDDGGLVAFDAFDGNLVAGDNNRAYDVFVRNVAAVSTELISVGLPGLPSLSPNAPSVISSSCLSTNGRYVTYLSEGDNLAPNDTNGIRDVYARDLVSGNSFLVSANTNGVAGNGISTDAAISGDGRFIVFTSNASDLVANDTNSASDIFLRDLQSATTLLVSMNSSGNGPGNSSSYSPTISDDGRYVLYASKAGDLVSGSVSNKAGNLFWRDIQAGTNHAITKFSPSAQWITSLTAAMTPDGKRVIYSFLTNAVAVVKVYVWDAQLAENVYTNSSSESFAGIYKTAISPDGNRIAIHRRTQVSIVDLTTHTEFLITNSTTSTGGQLTHAGFHFSADSQFLTYVASENIVILYDFSAASNIVVSAGANGISDSPTLSADGRFVAYRSAASNLVADDTNGVPDIFLYDRLTGGTTLITASPYGGWPANSRSFSPLFSRDGQTLLWQSWANNLAGQDFNQWCDLFALKAFATNSSDPQGSFSLVNFGFYSLGGFGSSASIPGFSWSASPGSNYLIQFKDELENPLWQDLTGAVRIIGNQGFVVDSAPGSTQRFYRVLTF